jgi:hypothetical protein
LDTEAAVRPVVVVVVLPFLEFVVGDPGVVDHHAVGLAGNSSASMRWLRPTLPLRRGVAGRM